MKRKIDAMHAEYGYGGGKCSDCIHFHRVEQRSGRTLFKCSLYGFSASEATDWRAGYLACGMVNRPAPERYTPLIDVLKTRARTRRGAARGSNENSGALAQVDR